MQETCSVGLPNVISLHKENIVILEVEGRYDYAKMFR